MSAIPNNDARSPYINSNDRSREDETYRLRILIIKDEEGSYSAVALNLPGVGSCGETADQALENVAEAARAALEAYKDHGEDIPWKDASSTIIPRDAEEKWISVDAWHA